MPRASKYHAKPTTVDGIRFASQKEARRYGELKLLEKAGEITGLLLQPRYGLYILPFARQARNLRELVKCGVYVGDFQYWEAGVKVVEDVKGVRTPVYRLKKKIVEAIYDIEIREV